MPYMLGKHFLITSLFSLGFLLAQSVFAADAPNLISPSDNSNEGKSPKLIWEYTGGCIEGGSCFRIEVDNTADFSSPDKSSYTNSFSYSPQGLPNGNWSWRVKAKDKNEIWSDWSTVFKFNIGSGSSSTQPISQPVPSPSRVSASATPSKSDNAFIIKDLPSEINSDQDFEISVFLSLPDKATTRFHLKGAFKKSDSSNYFGESFIGNSWIKNNSSYSNQFRVETDKDGKWEGKIKVRPDIEDSGFDGTGSYVFKVGRYTDSGGGPTWSNELGVKINAVNIPEPTKSGQPEEEPGEEVESEDSLEESLTKAAPSRAYEIKIASVAGEATKSDNITPKEEIRVLEEKRVNWVLVFLGLGVVGGGAGYTFYKFKKR